MVNVPILRFYVMGSKCYNEGGCGVLLEGFMMLINCESCVVSAGFVLVVVRFDLFLSPNFVWGI